VGCKDSLHQFRQLISGISAGSNVVGVAAIVVMVLVTVSDVIGRRIFGSPIIGTLEIVRFMMAMAVFLTIAHAGVNGDHVTCDVFFMLFPRKIKSSIEIITSLLSLVLWGLVSWQLGKKAVDLLQVGESSMLLRVPTFPFLFIAAFGSGLLALVILVQFITSLGNFPGIKDQKS